MSKSKKQDSDVLRALRYASKITEKDGCWLYRPDKYNNYIDCKVPHCDYFETKTTMVHRFMYAVANDTPLKQSDIIMHTCHNRTCINPKHLKLGTHKENNWRNQ